MDELSLTDIIATLKRRSRLFFGVASLLFLIALFYTLNWSNYRSTATVEIEQAYISQNIAVTNGQNVNNTVFSLAEQRISRIQQKVTSVPSLGEIISKFNLYPQIRKNAGVADVADVMRSKIKLAFVTSVATNAGALKETSDQTAAIAFTLSFDYDDPHLAQQVTSELVTRFLDEDLKQRRLQTTETSGFIDSQTKELEATLAEQEKKIAAFRAKHGESGPSILMFNEQGAATTNFSIQNIESQIVSNEGTQGSLKAQLATVSPYSRVLADGQVITTPAIQLKALEAQYATLSSQYGPKHPDVIKASKQIAALKKQVSKDKGQGSAQLKSQIADLESNLAAAESTKGEDNPDVTALKSQLKKLKTRLDNTPDSPEQDDLVQDADNPAYLQLAAQLGSAQAQHKSLTAQRDTLLKQHKEYEKDIAAIPALEQEMATLTRDYENSQLRYRELKEKKMGADMAGKLEEDHKGQRLLIINPPKLPRKTQPARLLLILGGLAFAIIGGLGSVIVTEAINSGIQGQNHMESVFGTAPLVVIPHIRTEEEIRQRKRSKPYIAGAIALALLALCIIFIAAA